MKARLLDVAMALAIDGTLFLNAAHIFHVEGDGPAAVGLLLREMLGCGAPVFIGIPLSGHDRVEALRRLANGAADAAGHVVGQRRRRESVRKSGRRDS
jgi:hypothetical protein